MLGSHELGSAETGSTIWSWIRTVFGLGPRVVSAAKGYITNVLVTERPKPAITSATAGKPHTTKVNTK